jgi:hypothetical protein
MLPFLSTVIEIWASEPFPAAAICTKPDSRWLVPKPVVRAHLAEVPIFCPA